MPVAASVWPMNKWPATISTAWDACLPPPHAPRTRRRVGAGALADAVIE